MSCTSMRAPRTKCRDELLVAAERRRVAVVEQDEVDVARVVELAGAELAHAQHREGRRLGIAADGELSVAGELQQDRIGEGAEAARGEGAERAGDLVERPDPGDVGDGDSERHAALELAQAGRHRVGRRARARVGAHGVELALRDPSRWHRDRRRHRSVIKIGFCSAVSVRYGLLPNRASSSATAVGSSGRAAFSLHRVHATARRSGSCGRGRRAVESQDMRCDGSGKLLQSGGTLAQARCHRQEVEVSGLGQANLSGMRARNGRRRPRPGRARGGGRASPDGRPGRPRLPEGAVRHEFGRRAGQRHHAPMPTAFPWNGAGSASRCGWSSPGCASPMARTR